MTQIELEKLLEKNDIHVDDVSFNGTFFTISIEWGDWKHDHIALRNFLKKNGFAYFGNETTEEDGSDCYSANHYCAYIEK